VEIKRTNGNASLFSMFNIIELCVDLKKFFSGQWDCYIWRCEFLFLIILSELTFIKRVIYLWRKVVCLFCFVLFVLMRFTELGCFRSHSWCLWKALNEDGCLSLVPWCLDLWCKSSWILNKEGLAVQKFLNIEWFLHYKLKL